MYIYIYMYMHIYIYIYVYLYIYIYVCVCGYLHTCIYSSNPVTPSRYVGLRVVDRHLLASDRCRLWLRAQRNLIQGAQGTRPLYLAAPCVSFHNIYICIYISIYMYIYIYIYIYICMYVCMYIYVYLLGLGHCIYKCMHAVLCV